MRKEKYQLSANCEMLDNTTLDRAKFYLIKKVKNGRDYYDVVMEIDNFVFEMNVAGFYSTKTKDLYRHLCYHLAQGH